MNFHQQENAVPAKACLFSHSKEQRPKKKNWLAHWRFLKKTKLSFHKAQATMTGSVSTLKTS